MRRKRGRWRGRRRKKKSFAATKALISAALLVKIMAEILHNGFKVTN